VIPRCRRQRLAIQREGHGQDVARMALERLQRPSRPAVPEPDGAIGRCRRQRLDLCQNVCSRLTAFRLEQIEHLLSRYINDIDCVLTAEEAVRAERRISCSSSQRSHVTTNPGQHHQLTTHSRDGMILTLSIYCDGVASPALLVAVDSCSLLWLVACQRRGL
jgi:hypothetical protein